ncbi:hypothetical protein Cgig2_012251 [Carnegiea gigantea]|uniref:60S acidic ribosomal protein P2 n=1 Tax=Carnegiea gigantea TaxID=171969 RepID=A0A9Q1JPT5_9CARY|nr:hypothetical protein Cgig2_012251 [Carnegiea gigantea]
MKVVAAYMLAVLGGNPNPSADDLRNILNSVGCDADEEKVELLMFQVKGRDIAELVAAGREKLASVPAGGGACVAVSAGGAATGGGAAPAAAESKKEEKVEEKEESDDVIFLSPNLFYVGVEMTWASVFLTKRFRAIPLCTTPFFFPPQFRVLHQFLPVSQIEVRLGYERKCEWTGRYVLYKRQWYKDLIIRVNLDCHILLVVRVMRSNVPEGKGWGTNK